MNQAMIIDDDEDYRHLLARKLGRSFPGIDITEIDPLTMSLPGEDYSWDKIDFIILDYQLGLDFTGLDWFKRFKPEQMPATILLTARGSEELAVKAIKLGIDDYIVKENFDTEKLSDSINESVYNKKLEKTKLQDLINQSTVFNKPNFIRKLGLITGDNSNENHLFVFNPDACHQVGKEKGLSSQDNFIHHIANNIYRYLSSKRVDCNLFIYKEEYIAAIIKSKSYKRHLNNIYKILEGESFIVGSKKYTCSTSVGVISPGSLLGGEFNKSDFELLGIAQILCDSAKSNTERKICTHGDINIREILSPGNRILAHKSEPFDMEKAIADGRVSANYQPWIYIASDETVNVKDVYDVRIEVIDFDGDKITQGGLICLLDDAFAKRIVDRWVLRHTVTQLQEMSGKSGNLSKIKFAIKITLSTVTDPEFISWLKDLFNDADLPKGCLMFEIESSQFMRDPEQYKTLIEGFGKFYDIKFILSGIYQINTYYEIRGIQKFNYIKLNVKDLIYGFPRAPLYGLINTIREDGAKIVAINVADAEMLNLVTDFDIDYVHGYLVGRPFTGVIADSGGDFYHVI